jgi:hypothetical protein
VCKGCLAVMNEIIPEHHERPHIGQFIPEFGLIVERWWQSFWNSIKHICLRKRSSDVLTVELNLLNYEIFELFMNQIKKSLTWQAQAHMAGRFRPVMSERLQIGI